MSASGRRAIEGDDARVVATDEHCFRATGIATAATSLAPVSKRGARYDRRNSSESFCATRAQETLRDELERGTDGIRVAHFRVSLVRVKAALLDAYTREGLLRLGLRHDDLTAPDNTKCLELADVAREIGCAGLIVPSAAVPAATNIVIWREAVPDAVDVISWTIVEMPYRSTGTDA
jgi:RES domain-containing protein